MGRRNTTDSPPSSGSGRTAWKVIKTDKETGVHIPSPSGEWRKASRRGGVERGFARLPCACVFVCAETAGSGRRARPRRRFCLAFRLSGGGLFEVYPWRIVVRMRWQHSGRHTSGLPPIHQPLMFSAWFGARLTSMVSSGQPKRELLPPSLHFQAD